MTFNASTIDSKTSNGHWLLAKCPSASVEWCVGDALEMMFAREAAS